jgi:hypothetical protein
MAKPTIFISYSHKDEVWKDRLMTHLRVPEDEGILELWEDRRIDSGEEWYQEIEKAIKRSSMAIFLVSADFLTSKFIREKEVPELLERRIKEGLYIFPVIIKPCVWKKVKWLHQMNVRPKDGKPLQAGNEFQIEHNMTIITEEITDLIEKISSDNKKSQQNDNRKNRQLAKLEIEIVKRECPVCNNIIDSSKSLSL